MGLNGCMSNRPLDEWCISDTAELQQSIKETEPDWHLPPQISQIYANISLFIIHYSLYLQTRCMCECWSGYAFIRVIILTCQSFMFTVWDMTRLYPLSTRRRHIVACYVACRTRCGVFSHHYFSLSVSMFVTYWRRSCVTSELAKTPSCKGENIEIHVKLANMLTPSRLTYAKKNIHVTVRDKNVASLEEASLEMTRCIALYKMDIVPQLSNSIVNEGEHNSMKSTYTVNAVLRFLGPLFHIRE